MIIKENLQINSVSWLSMPCLNGVAKRFYEPESVEELIDLCSSFFINGLSFDLIGHTSNTLYTKGYICERMVSTRKLTQYEFTKDYIYCQCGVSVRQLALVATNEGINGFEGLIDLPGTVASAIYGHATCYGCDLSQLLLEATVLTDDGLVITVNPDWFGFTERSSVLKRKEKKGVILELKLKKSKGNPEELKRLALKNHELRKNTQPEAKNSLGSIFRNEGHPTFLYYVLNSISYFYGIFFRLLGKSTDIIKEKRKHLIFTFLGAKDIESYVRRWNWYQWRDEQSHELFWKYVQLHRRLFSRSDFEIEIKHNSNFKIPLN